MNAAVAEELKQFHAVLARLNAKCGHGSNSGKPGPCPEDRPDAGGEGQFSALHQQAQKKATALVQHIKQIPAKIYAAAKKKVTDTYQKLAARYGKPTAVAIVGAGLLGTATPLPGGGVIAASPIIAAAELYLRLRAAFAKDLPEFLTRGESAGVVWVARAEDSLELMAWAKEKGITRAFVAPRKGLTKPIGNSSGTLIPTPALSPRHPSESPAVFAERGWSFLQAAIEESHDTGADILIVAPADHLTVTKAWGAGQGRRAGILRIDASGETWEALPAKSLDTQGGELPTIDPAAYLLDRAPDVRQFTDFQCGAAASCCVAMIHGVGPGADLWLKHEKTWQTPEVQAKVKEAVEQWADILGTTVEQSTRPQAIIETFQKLGCPVEARHNLTIADLDAYTRKGWPVICCAQDWWSEQDPRAEFDYGHYLTVLAVGLGNRVVCQDSSIENAEYLPGGDVPGDEADDAGNIAEPGRIIVRADQWMRAWHDEDINGKRYFHFGIAIGPPPLAGATVEKSHDGNSFFAECDRDEHGHCKPGSGSGDEGGTKPAPAANRHPSFPGAPGARSPSPDAPTRNADAPANIHEAPTRRPDGTPDLDHDESGGHDADARQPGSWAERSALHQALEQTPAHLCEKIKEGGINKAYVLTLEDGTQCLFKPVKGEEPDVRVGVPDRSMYRREVAASRLADVLGFGDLVPTTTVREQPRNPGANVPQAMGVGSAQLYVPRTEKPLDSHQPFDGPKDAARAAVFDYLLGHLDRHHNNWLLKDDKLVLIDNGASLPTKYDERDFFNMKMWFYAALTSLPMPGGMTAMADKWPETEKALRDSGIEDEAIALAKERFEAVTSGKYKHVKDLPTLIPGEKGTLGEMARFYNQEARWERMQKLSDWARAKGVDWRQLAGDMNERERQQLIDDLNLAAK